jgi:hypothetical protein
MWLNCELSYIKTEVNVFKRYSIATEHYNTVYEILYVLLLQSKECSDSSMNIKI